MHLTSKIVRNLRTALSAGDYFPLITILSLKDSKRVRMIPTTSYFIAVLTHPSRLDKAGKTVVHIASRMKFLRSIVRFIIGRIVITNRSSGLGIG
jgi:hypothetical protein